MWKKKDESYQRMFYFFEKMCVNGDQEMGQRISKEVPVLAHFYFHYLTEKMVWTMAAIVDQKHDKRSLSTASKLK